ncbi:toll/interleukin-1 receptor domain-containing protein [Streptomyces sp. NPDC088387]|uniref:toll/interleukin-1 receptor domain-containing protein n=1 Tax=Streptomyces sp. NPDC088387 TaxID=3365859 RepID=UPI00380654BB
MRFAAFISYSHSADTHRARRLRQALHNFARPWTRLRALRVFLDNSSLSADPALWSTVEQALADSEFLILLASPDSAASEWVGKEVAWWRAGPRPGNLLLVVTGGELHWDHGTEDYDWERTDCLPEALRGHFTEEPRWVDLRWMGESDSGEPSDPRFQENVADLAATLHDRPKDELIGEDVSQRRRFRRFRRGMLASVTALAVLATTAAVFAFVQRDTAREQARIATARELAATALNLAGDDLETASLLALQAYELEKAPETLSALYRLTAQSPRLVRFVRAGETVTALALTASPEYLAVGTADGAVDVWNADGTRKVRTVRVPGPVDRLSFSDDGGLLAVATRSGRTVVQELGGKGARRELAGGSAPVRGMTFFPFEHVLAVIDDEGALRFYDDTGTRPVETVDTDIPAALNLAVLDAGSKVFVSHATGWTTYAVEGGRMTEFASSDETVYPFNDHIAAASPSGTCYGFVKYGGVDLSSPAEQIGSETGATEAEPGGSDCGAPPGLVGDEAESLAVSDDGRAALGTSDGLVVTTSGTEDRADALETLTGVEAPSVMTFSPGPGDRLVSADGSTVALWSLGTPGPTAQRPGVAVPDDTIIPEQHPLAVGPDGSLAWSHDSAENAPSTLETWAPGDSAEQTVPGREATTPYEAIAYDGSGDTLYTATREALETWAVSPDSLVRKDSVPLTPAEDFAGKTLVASRPDGKVAVLAADGSVALVDPSSGKGSTVVRPREANLTAQERTDHVRAAYATALGEKAGLAAVAADDGHVDVHELPSGRRLHRLSTSASPVRDLFVSERTRSLYATVGDGVLERWDLETGERLWRSDGAGDRGLTADAAGQWVASLAGDGTVWLWDAATGDRLGSTVLPETFTIAGLAGAGGHSSLAFADDGKRLWSITEGGSLLSWDTSADAWIKAVCDRVGRPLTEVERTRYLTSISRGPTPCA